MVTLLDGAVRMFDPDQAGYGPLSDGVPEAIGAGGDSEKQLPPPPRVSRPVHDEDKTVQLRKP